MSYVPVIGLEIHARIKTRTKLFCRCANEAVPVEANRHVCPICMGFPGMLPLLNEEAVRLATRACLALGMTICPETKFDRKNYFYPDLPMGYQISQFDKPIGADGHLFIEQAGSAPRRIGIERLHMENDAGKLSHFDDGSHVDYNRAGAPLMEIVSMPEIFSVDDAKSYAEEMQLILRAVGSSDADMEKGMMRFDANISLRADSNAPFGTKVEIKNLNSFKALEKALAYEIDRQTRLLEKGETIVQETRGWDEGSGKTISQRSKEIAADYRYFPEPDLPPLSITQEHIDAERSKLPELPFAKRERYKTIFKLDGEVARLLVQQEDLAQYFEQVAERTGNPKAAATWVTSILLAELSNAKERLEDLRFPVEDLARLITLVSEDAVSLLSAKETFSIMYATGQKPDAIIAEKGFLQVSDDSALLALIDEVLAAFPLQRAEYAGGKTALLGFFVGQVMQRSKGSANPKKVGQLLLEKLS
ncbi:Asp-tRNA(Asn)/Glu-tRNA(Gln) amidotransferase GatCAB subunit B [Candidatus Gracilibacteria bacterium CG17_big_fil_post_rev_8_21_14_2_50_48_13]|nr:MAG: Asp-tRNA(Asn)/Glu-tRNA(Gln) amidotransferase GatCAB subunit B [Candidatus Gracilibacteria bacterium CG17_big_fil_post_rev_8_21_14_2_50_48_13]